MIFIPFKQNFQYFFLLLVVSIFTLTGPKALAAPASHNAAAEELLRITNASNRLNGMTAQILAPIRSRFSMVRTDPERAKLFRRHLDEVTALVSEQMSWENNKAAFIDLYTETYTEAELEELNTFLKSPLGQKFLSPKPEFNQRVAAIAAENIEAIKPQIKASEERLRADLANLTKAEKTPQPEQ